ncbi:MAG: metallophosphoesterase [Candidatus Sumerlaeaceae bacterium]|nr:metallophosphoesterase [Candidatus Sumerlaeaceae bacterium]
MIAAASGAAADFATKPWLQLGDNPRLSTPETVQVLWQTSDTQNKWSVEVAKGDPSAPWRKCEAPASVPLAAITSFTLHLWTANLADLEPGKPFRYRLRADGKTAFEATGAARKHDSKTRFVAFGDCGAETTGQQRIAYQASLLKPDYVFITGDIVYNYGLVSEYLRKYFPVYNADVAGPKSGAPLIRSTLFLAAPGNHDLLRADLNRSPDALGYYYYWSQPLNGPLTGDTTASITNLKGSDQAVAAFKAAAGSRWPRSANYSFDYGTVHWTVLDSNPYVDWSDRKLREWVDKDLESAKSAKWRIVAFHHPPFQSSKAHQKDQWMRLLADIFEKHKVSVVLAGHVHNYQRSHPLRFVADGTTQGVVQRQKDGQVPGTWTLDKTFDGATHTKPEGPLYIVSGAGGAGLYNADQQPKPNTWQPFTVKYIADKHSLTVVDVSDEAFEFQQISDRGETLDTFKITR